MTDRCAPGGNLPSHRLSWADFDALAKGEGDARVTERFRRAERSRRLLLLRALVDEAGKTPDIPGPLASLEDAWELMARAGDKDPAALESILAHPHTGSWAGYTVRLLRHHISGVSPLWVHVGHMHALAAAAAIRQAWNSVSRCPSATAASCCRLSASPVWAYPAIPLPARRGNKEE